MANQKERELVKAVYKNSPTWAKKVDAMSDAQLTAIYMRFKLKGLIK